MLYPEGAHKKTLITFSIKWLNILIIGILLAYTIQFITQKIEDNSKNAQYRIALKYLYIKNDVQFKKTIEGIMLGMQNDSIKSLITNEIDRSSYVLK